MRNLCSGNTCANPSACSTSVAKRPRRRPGRARRRPRAVGAQADLARRSRGRWALVAGDHLHRGPRGRAASIVGRNRPAGGSARGRTPSSRQRPVAVGAGDGQRPATRPGRSVDGLRPHRGASPLGSSTRSRITWGAPLLTRTAAPSATATVASVRLWTGSNGSEADDLDAVERAERAGGGQHGPVDRVPGPRRWDASAAARMTVVGRHAGRRRRLADLETVLGQRPGLVGAEHVDAAELLDGGEVADHRFLAGQTCRARPPWSPRAPPAARPGSTPPPPPARTPASR